MRNPRMERLWIGRLAYLSWLGAAGLMFAGACADNSQNRQELNAGEDALRAQQYDRALRAADDVAASGVAQNAAEAHYLHGRAIEDRPKPDPAAAAADLAEARRYYALALGEYPSPALQGRLRAQIGNVAYFQDDYAVALQQWTIASAQLDNPQWKQWILYRIGICQQRLGRFDDADHTFAVVQDEYPGTEVARRAQARQGVHGFYVQVGAFNDSSDVQKAAYAVTSAGSIAEEIDQRGLKVVRSAGLPSYAQATALKTRLVGEYPDARVMP
jgi:tetratricopeptide (TPR) repeat protein